MSANKQIGSIPFSVGLRLVNPSEKDSAKVAVAYVQSRENVDNHTLARHIKEHGTPFSIGTLHGVIDDICECIAEQLLMGNRVTLDGLGTLFVSLSSTGTGDANEFTSAQITSVNPRMSFDEEFVKTLQKAEFENVASRKAQIQAKKQEKTAMNEILGATDAGSDPTGDTGSSTGSGDPDDVTP